MKSEPSIQDLGGPACWSHIAGANRYQRLGWPTTICPAKCLAVHDGLNPAAAEYLPPVKPGPPRITGVGALLVEAMSWAALELFLSVCFLKGPGLLVALFGLCSLAILQTGHRAMISV